jgi:hypothetical protein
MGISRDTKKFLTGNVGLPGGNQLRQLGVKVNCGQDRSEEYETNRLSFTGLVQRGSIDAHKRRVLAPSMAKVCYRLAPSFG